VTGGAGFIGSGLVRHLLAQRPNADVVNLDALTYAGHLKNLDGVGDRARHRFVEGDICDAGLVREVMEGVDVVFNLAAESHVDRSIVEDQPFVVTNVLGTATLLAAALDAGVERFVQVSTDEVYGELDWVDPEEQSGDAVEGTAAVVGGAAAARFTEDMPLAPRSPYAATKAAADLLALAYHTTHGMDVVVTRSSNNYGPRQFPEKLIPLMITRALADEPLPVYGDGLHVRDWIHVEDHCRGLLAAADGGGTGCVYNFGGDAERTNLALVRDLLSMLERPDSLIEFVADRPGHDRRYAIDSSRARAQLDWAPAVGLGDGLRRTVEWYRENAEWVEAVTAENGPLRRR
jgi:dTDP-glucose 4,6-dehydratase